MVFHSNQKLLDLSDFEL